MCFLNLGRGALPQPDYHSQQNTHWLGSVEKELSQAVITTRPNPINYQPTVAWVELHTSAFHFVTHGWFLKLLQNSIFIHSECEAFQLSSLLLLIWALEQSWQFQGFAGQTQFYRSLCCSNNTLTTPLPGSRAVLDPRLALTQFLFSTNPRLGWSILSFSTHLSH